MFKTISDSGVYTGKKFYFISRAVVQHLHPSLLENKCRTWDKGTIQAG